MRPIVGKFSPCQLMMAVYAKHKCFAASCGHELLPWLFSLLDIRQFSHVMDLEVSPFPLTVFTFVGGHPFEEFASACVLVGPWGVVHFAVKDGFSVHVLEPEELEFLNLS